MAPSSLPHHSFHDLDTSCGAQTASSLVQRDLRAYLPASKIRGVGETRAGAEERQEGIKGNQKSWPPGKEDSGEKVPRDLSRKGLGRPHLG